MKAVTNGAMVPLSRPAWARGLKHESRYQWRYGSLVAPCVGAWIETGLMFVCSWATIGRALRGRVD